MSIWDLAKPVIAQVHGIVWPEGVNSATCCDLVYIAEDAQMGYPATVLVFQICISIHGFRDATGNGNDDDR